MDASTHAINWFEIPMTEVARAKAFYEQVFDIKMEEFEMAGMAMVMFPSTPGAGNVNGALVKSEYHQPSTTGALLYLNANPDLSAVLDRVEAAGGQVNMPKTLIDAETGYMAFFLDSEGNRIGLHSQE